MNSKPERDKLIKENIRLAYYFIGKVGGTVSNLYHEEIESDAFYALVKAAATFDNTKGVKFAKYYSTIFMNEVRMRLRNRDVRARKTNVPLDAETVQPDGSSATFLEFMADKVNVEDEVVTCLSATQLLIHLRKYSKKCYEVFRMSQQGMLQREIAVALNMSQSYVSRILKRSRRVILHLYQHGILPPVPKMQKRGKSKRAQIGAKTKPLISPELLIGEISRQQISNVSF